MQKSTQTKICAILAGAITTSIVAACSSTPTANGTGATSGAGDASIQVANVEDLSGPEAQAGIAIERGISLAISDVNSQHELGSKRLVLKTYDTQGDVQNAINLTTQAENSNAMAIFGPSLGNEALAAAPIAQRAQVPYIATQSQTTGIVETGDFIYRLTAPQSSFQNLTIDELASKGVKSVGYIYESDNANNVQLQGVQSNLLQAKGIRVVDSEKVLTTDTNYAAAVGKIVALNPQAVGVLAVVSQSGPIVSQLRQAGYKGIIFGQEGFDGGALKPDGEAANGALWASDFSPLAACGSVATSFVDEWKKKNDGVVPSNFNAEGYDAVLFLAKAIEAGSGTPSRSSIREGMATVAAEGFDGVLGKITFDGRDERVGGVELQWDSATGAAVPVSKPQC
jgi:branched-chain amino acid transport system substrate-binding protein